MNLEDFDTLSTQHQAFLLRRAPKGPPPWDWNDLTFAFASGTEAQAYALAMMEKNGDKLSELTAIIGARIDGMREMHRRRKADKQPRSQLQPQSPTVTDSVEENVDYSGSKPIPAWIREVIETHLAIEAEDAKSAGALGFMARALVIATMPYKDPKADAFMRKNGQFTLRIVAGFEGGIPYGIYPRLLMSWLTTEAVRTGKPTIELGESLGVFLQDVMDIRSKSGGPRSSRVRFSEQMKRLFGSFITAQFQGDDKKSFKLRGIQIAEDLDLDFEEMDRLDQGALWTPQASHEAGQWKSKVRLTDKFFQELITSPVPIDIRAYKSLRGSPLAMDIYTWLTYRLSYVQRPTAPIPWEVLMLQFGSGFGGGDVTDQQAIRDFRKGFKTALDAVSIIYPKADLKLSEAGIVLLPSPTHVPKGQIKLL